jgi:hypothetical protein
LYWVVDIINNIKDGRRDTAARTLMSMIEGNLFALISHFCDETSI